MTDAEGTPDVELGGSFRAAEVTFHELSGVRVTTSPEQPDDRDRVRENLPEEPSTGQTYRDVYLRRRLGARLGVDVGGDPSEGRTHGD